MIFILSGFLFSFKKSTNYTCTLPIHITSTCIAGGKHNKAIVSIISALTSKTFRNLGSIGIDYGFVYKCLHYLFLSFLLLMC